MDFKRFIGYVSLITVMLSTTGQTELTQALQTKLKYDKPFCIVWFNHSWIVLLLPMQAAYHHWRTRTRPGRSLAGDSHSPLLAAGQIKGSRKGWLETIREDTGFTVRHLLQTGAWMSVLYAGGDYMWFRATPFISASAAVAIFNSSCCFVYLLSICLLKDSIVPLKMASVLMAAGGVCLIAFFPGTHHVNPEATPSQALAGMLSVLGAAVLYAFYEVLSVKYAVPNITSVAVINTVNGFIGLANLCWGWVVIVLLHYTGVEPFELPDSGNALSLVLNGFLGFLFNMSLIIACALTSPTLGSLAILLAIPSTAAADVLLHGDAFTIEGALGGVAILGSFVLMECHVRQSPAGTGTGAAAEHLRQPL